MTTSLLLLAITVAMICDIIVMDGRLEGSSPQYTSISTKKRMKEFVPFRAQRKEKGEKLEEVTTKSRDNNQIFNETLFKTSFERRRILPRNNIIPKDRKSVQIFENVVSAFRRKRQVLKDYGNRSRIWDNGVFYTFNTSDQVLQETFKKAAEVWSDNTCIDFIQDRYAKDKVVVYKSDEGASIIGRFGGAQPLALTEKTSVGDAVHEIGHVLGFYHTQSRFDRDYYVALIPQNIDPHNIDDFFLMSEEHTDVFGLTYDYGSIMHYSELVASINGLPTMIALNPYYQKTMGSGLISFSDIYMINERYGCNAKCNKSTSAKCKNEGIPHPRNCSICICPSGYGGTLCDRRPPGCGVDLVAANVTKVVDCTLGSGSSLRDLFDFCNYMITAPVGKRIEVTVLSIRPYSYDIAGCKVGGIEIKAQKDQKLTGIRLCSVKGIRNTIVSNTNPLPVIVFGRYSVMKTIFSYRYID